MPTYSITTISILMALLLVAERWALNLTRIRCIVITLLRNAATTQLVIRYICYACIPEITPIGIELGLGGDGNDHDEKKKKKLELINNSVKTRKQYSCSLIEKEIVIVHFIV